MLDPQERAALYASLKKLQAALDDTAPQPASHATEQPAQQLAARLFEVLRGQPHAHGGEEILDVPGVEFVAVGLADAVDQPHLQRMIAMVDSVSGSSSSAPLVMAALRMVWSSSCSLTLGVRTPTPTPATPAVARAEARHCRPAPAPGRPWARRRRIRRLR